jgi:hypothetical protein
MDMMSDKLKGTGLQDLLVAETKRMKMLYK